MNKKSDSSIKNVNSFDLAFGEDDKEMGFANTSQKVGIDINPDISNKRSRVKCGIILKGSSHLNKVQGISVKMYDDLTYDDMAQNDMAQDDIVDPEYHETMVKYGTDYGTDNNKKYNTDNNKKYNTSNEKKHNSDTKYLYKDKDTADKYAKINMANILSNNNLEHMDTSSSSIYGQFVLCIVCMLTTFILALGIAIARGELRHKDGKLNYSLIACIIFLPEFYFPYVLLDYLVKPNHGC